MTDAWILESNFMPGNQAVLPQKEYLLAGFVNSLPQGILYLASNDLQEPDAMEASYLKGRQLEGRFKAFGSIIGKTLRPLTDGQGLIPILVALPWARGSQRCGNCHC